MQEKKNNLEACWKRKHEEAVKKAKDAIAELVLRKEPVNFNSVHKMSGVAKSYLYKNEELRSLIEQERQKEIAIKSAWHEKYDKTSKSKDVIIAAKDKRIAKLEEENRRLQNEVNNLMAKLYEL